MKYVKVICEYLRDFLIVFTLVGFIVSCTLMLFFNLVTTVEFTNENIEYAAKFTFLNVIILSLGFLVVDTIRRKIMVDAPVKKIKDALIKIKAGDFSVRLDSHGAQDNFKDIMEDINHMAEEISGVETLRTDFIANVSHEMKTPLAAMKNYGVLLQAPDLTDEKRLEYAKAITYNSGKLADMMTNILKLNKLENQQIYPESEEYNLSEQLCQCLLNFENVWEQCDIEIDTDIEDDVMIKADEELLSLVWNNLLSNAFKFTSEGGMVSVSLKNEGEYAVVKVRDTGCGMSAEVGAHMFEKFYQGDTSHATKGNGLGLALVKRVVDITQGEIGVESVLGEGSTFTVKIKRNA